MKIFIIVRDDATIANGVVFGPGATVVHSLLRRDRDSVTRFSTLSEVKQQYRDCQVQFVETSREATYTVRRTRVQREPAASKTKKKRTEKASGAKSARTSRRKL